MTASQPASLVVSAATAPAAHETEPAGRLEGGRRGVRARAPLPGDTSTHGERPARPTSAAATPPPCLLLMNTHSSRYTRTKHHCHNTTRRHRPISRSCLLPSCHCCHRAAASPCALLPGDNIPHTPHARRLAPPPLPPPTPWIAPTLAHALPHAPRLSCLPLPPTATPLDPLTAADRNSIHSGCSRPSALLPLGPCAAGPPAHPGPRSRRRRAQRKCPLLALGALALPEQSATCVGYSLPPPPAPRTSIDAARVASSARRARQQSAGTPAKHPRAHCSPRATAPRSLGNLAGCVGRCRGCDGWL